MRFMVLVKATEVTEAGGMPTGEMLAEVLGYHEALSKAGVSRDATGLKPTSQGWRIRSSGDDGTVIEGPFTDGA